MSEITTVVPRQESCLQRYWEATRPYSFTAAIVPAAIGTAAARLLVPGLKIDLVVLAIVVVGCIVAQAISNLVNDGVDARTGLDNPDNFGRFNCIVRGLITARELQRLVIALSVVAVGLTAALTAISGPWVLGLVAAGGFLAFQYTAPPLKLKYHALGDLAVVTGFGIGMVAGAYLAQTHGQLVLPLRLLLYALPSALLVVAILHANNHRDRVNDRQYGAATVANLLSESASWNLLYVLLVGPYLISILTASLGLTTVWAALSLLSVPALLKVLRKLQANDYAMIVPDIAKLHGLFGVLTTVGMVLGVRR